MNTLEPLIVSISTVNVGSYMIGEMDVYWENVHLERLRICENLIEKSFQENVAVICTQEDILLSNTAEDGRCEIEFYNVYEKYGYIALSQCVLQNNTSNTLEKLHPNKYVKLGNVIYVHRSYIYDIIPIPQMYPTTVCVAYCMIYGRVKLANAHLCGGRFDDQTIFQDENTYMEKIQQIQSIDASTIICGDLNSTRSYGKPGGLNDWEYPTFLAKSAIFRSINSPPKTNVIYQKPDHYHLTIDEKLKWTTWQCEPIEFIYLHPTISYRSCLNDKDLKKIGETTYRGKYVVDWIFYDSTRLTCIENKVIKLYGETATPLSDHHMISGKFMICSAA